MKCAVGIRQILSVPLGHDDVRMDAAGNANHLGRKVQPVRGGAASRGGGSEIAWSARYVEYMLTGRNFSGFQQRCDKGCCRMSEAVSVARSGTLPAGVLEGADGFGLKAHSTPTCQTIRPL